MLGTDQAVALQPGAPSSGSPRQQPERRHAGTSEEGAPGAAARVAGEHGKRSDAGAGVGSEATPFGTASDVHVALPVPRREAGQDAAAAAESPVVKMIWCSSNLVEQYEEEGSSTWHEKPSSMNMYMWMLALPLCVVGAFLALFGQLVLGTCLIVLGFAIGVLTNGHKWLLVNDSPTAHGSITYIRTYCWGGACVPLARVHVEPLDRIGYATAGMSRDPDRIDPVGSRVYFLQRDGQPVMAYTAPGDAEALVQRMNQLLEKRQGSSVVATPRPGTPGASPASLSGSGGMTGLGATPPPGVSPAPPRLSRAPSTHALDEETVTELETLFDFTGDEPWRCINHMARLGESTCTFATYQGIATFRGQLASEMETAIASKGTRSIAVDLSSYDGIVISATGDGKEYVVRLRVSDPQGTLHYFEHAFTPAVDVWSTIRLPFNQFQPHRPDLDNVQAFDLSVSRQTGPFLLQVDWIKAYAATGGVNLADRVLSMLEPLHAERASAADAGYQDTEDDAVSLGAEGRGDTGETGDFHVDRADV